MSGLNVVNLKVEDVIADEEANLVRYGINPSRVLRLADQIKLAGEVLTPVEVTPTEKPGKYKLVTGHYRHAAVSLINADGGGMLLPAIVRLVDDEQRLAHQLAENHERENLSPMDEAKAIQNALDRGKSKNEVLVMFARPGGRKGNEIKPASYAHVNMMLSFLKLDKSIQDKIHDGVIGVQAAYQLTKLVKDKAKQKALIDKLVADRVKALDNDEKLNKRLVEADEKAARKEEAAKKVITDKAEAEKKAEAASAAEKEAEEAEAVAHKAFKAASDEDKAEARKKFEAAKAKYNTAHSVRVKADEALAKIRDKVKKAAEKAKAATKDAAGKKKDASKISPQQVIAAATGSKKPLTRQDMTEAANDLAKHANPKVKLFGRVMLALMDSTLTTNQAADVIVAGVFPPAKS